MLFGGRHVLSGAMQTEVVEQTVLVMGDCDGCGCRIGREEVAPGESAVWKESLNQL
jgi:hypothetical protein